MKPRTLNDYNELAQNWEVCRYVDKEHHNLIFGYLTSYRCAIRQVMVKNKIFYQWTFCYDVILYYKLSPYFLCEMAAIMKRP